MAKKTTMWIAMANGGLLAAAAMGLSEDKPVDPHAPVEVPEEYDRHLIHDKFAYVAEPPVDEKPEPSKKPASGGKAQEPAASDTSGGPDASGAGQA